MSANLTLFSYTVNHLIFTATNLVILKDWHICVVLAVSQFMLFTVIFYSHWGYF